MLLLSGASRLCALVALSHGVAGLRWEGSQPTSSSFNSYLEMRPYPKPTVGISQVSLGLFRRDDSQSTVCGYISGLSGTLNSCSDGENGISDTYAKYSLLSHLLREHRDVRLRQ